MKVSAPLPWFCLGRGNVPNTVTLCIARQIAIVKQEQGSPRIDRPTVVASTEYLLKRRVGHQRRDWTARKSEWSEGSLDAVLGFSGVRTHARLIPVKASIPIRSKAGIDLTRFK
jgi:hypothetical protein